MGLAGSGFWILVSGAGVSGLIPHRNPENAPQTPPRKSQTPSNALL